MSGILRHCERSEAIHSFLLWRDGLLRFARNDGRGDGLRRGACHRARIRATRWLAMTGEGCFMPPLTLPVIARSAATKQSILSLRRNGLLRGACQRARIRATRWLAMTVEGHAASHPLAMTGEGRLMPPLILPVIARSVATKQSTLSLRGKMDCFAALAMTGEAMHCFASLAMTAGAMDCFAEPVIGRALARPVGSQ